MAEQHIFEMGARDSYVEEPMTLDDEYLTLDTCDSDQAQTEDHPEDPALQVESGQLDMMDRFLEMMARQQAMLDKLNKEVYAMKTNRSPSSQPPSMTSPRARPTPPLRVQAAYSAPSTFTIRPKDIPLLQLSELHGLSAGNRLRRFFEQVEDCTPSDHDRVRVALHRVDPEIEGLLRAKQAHCSDSWDTFKSVVRSQFASTHSAAEAWKEVVAETYDITEEPRAFLNRLRCKIAALANQFPHGEFPDADSVLKSKLFRGCPRSAQATLKHIWWPPSP